MAFNSSISTQTRLAGLRLDIDDAVFILPVDEVPLQRTLRSEPATAKRVEWIEDILTPQVATVSSSAGTGPWTLTLPAPQGFRFLVGDLVRVTTWPADRLVRVTTVTSGTSITVAVYSGTGHAFAASDVIEIVGQVNDEGADPGNPRHIDRTVQYNLTQIGQERVRATRTARQVGYYGLDDPYTYELRKKFRELAIRFEKALMVGVRAESGLQRSMGGLFYYITSNSQSGTAATVKTLLNNLLRSCWEAGGRPTVMHVAPNVKQAISANVDPTLRRVERSDRTGGFVVERFLSDFGEIDIVVNRYVPSRRGILIQPEFDVKKVLQGYVHEPLAKTGDSDNGMIVGEFSLMVKNEAAQGVLTVTDA